MATASDEDLAASAGFSVAFFKSDKELWRIFQKARKEQWAGSKLLQELRNSKWFAKNSEAQRQNQLLKESDPAEYRNRLDKVDAEIETIARRLGLTLSGSTRSALRDLAFNQNMTASQIENYLRDTRDFRNRSESKRELERLKAENPAEYENRFSKVFHEVRRISRQTGLGTDGALQRATAELAMLNNWTEEQIKAHLSRHGSVQSTLRKGGNLQGDAAAARHLVERLSADYGINISRGTLSSLVADIAAGRRDENYAVEWFRNKAKVAYRNIAEDIDAGLTVRQIADPYIDMMSRTLEMNPRSIDVFDPTIKSALTKRGGIEDQSDFEIRLRNDERWNKTTNAREAYMGAATQLLQQMGVLA